MIGSRVRLVGTTLDGMLVGKSSYIDRMDRFTVRYMDAVGSPQEREFTASEISFDGREALDNVVDFRRVG
ncbi:hypothetical protein [Mesorhizobium sp. NZP2298]|uniref:hypothetical protein n=1 Tax=Mesorhizobium sp. NZP2298 TaxID=2483403 RepID=UPI0015558141|nr:hypothetical protein [Mesorhizobium sp. NZP2298]QKC99214.1 hypothetical protein EB231_35090 [Mesorhizobium sp. NZP2298]